LIRTPTPDFSKMSLPIYFEVGPSLPSFLPYFSSFCTNASFDGVNQAVVFLGYEHIPIVVMQVYPYTLGLEKMFQRLGRT
jgi:hypothetical protein